MTKKGDLSINIIIVAAIALLVLIILAVLILRTGNRVDVGTRCEALGGNCESECDLTAGYFVDSAGSCPGEDVCCRRFGADSEENP